MSLQYVNGFSKTLAAPVAAIDTTIVLEAGAGALLPDAASLTANPMRFVLREGSVAEVVEATSRAVDTLTVTRAVETVEGLSTAQVFTVAAIIENSPTKETMEQFLEDGDTLATGLTLPNTGLHLLDTNASHDLIIAPGSDLTADHTLTITTGDADRTLTLTGAASLEGTNTGDQTISLTSDVTGSGTGSFATTIANDAVTYAKMQNVSAASKLIGRGDSGAGDPEEITIGTGLVMSGTTLSTGGTNSIYQGNSSVTVTDAGDGYIALTEDGAEIMRVTGGNVAIGATSGSQKLHVAGSAYVTTRVGVGSAASSPSYGVHVSNTDNGAQVACESTAGNCQVNLINTGTGGVTWQVISTSGTADAGRGGYFVRQTTVGYAAIGAVANGTGANVGLGGAITGTSGVTATLANAKVFINGSTGAVGIGNTNPSNALDVTGILAATSDIKVTTAGKGLFIKEGANAKMGQAVLVAGTVTVSTTAVTANSRIFLTRGVAGGTLGHLSVGTITASTSFVINSSDAADTSTINWLIIEPA